MSNVLITGATSGIGYEFAKIFAKNTFDLILVARNEDRLKEIKVELESEFKIKVSTFKYDLSDPTSSEKLVKELEDKNMNVNILINNAGFGSSGSLAEHEYSKIVNEINLNVLTLTSLTRLIVPQMIQRHEGKILNVASVASFFPGPYMSVYFATKAYVLSFSHAISEELKNEGITVTTLCPGPTRTNFANAANANNTIAFKNPDIMTALQVATDGYDALMQGKRTIIPGISNKFSTLISRLLPTSLELSIIKRINR